jgi:hypothetical protein
MHFVLPKGEPNLATRIPEMPVEVLLWWGDSIPGWVILQPLQVRIVRDSDGYFNAGDDVFHVYGDGLTREEALQDYKVALVEFYELVVEGAQDDPHDQALLARLQQYLRRI